MPELPEVERGRRIAEHAARGRLIVEVQIADDAIVFDGAAVEVVRAALVGARVQSVHRRGKYLWFALDRRPWPVFHFGMTGAFKVPGGAALPLASSPREPDMGWPPRFVKIRMVFEDGGELAMTNARRLGRILLRDVPSDEPPISRLGFDPLLDFPSAAVFAECLGRRGAKLKGLLLDQGFAAGVGNWIADEVLYQARLDPRRKANSLDEAEVVRLRDALAHVIETAVAADAIKERFPSEWLFHHRWGRADGARTATGEQIEFLTVAGRTTAWVPSVQGGPASPARGVTQCSSPSRC